MRTAVSLLPVLLALAGCSRSSTPPPEADDDSGPVIRVTASYPGASAHVTQETVAFLLLQQINGAEGLVRLESECRDEGTCEITARFKPGTDIKVAQVVVQNRVALAQAGLPLVVQREGVAVLKGDPDRFPRLWVAVASPDGTHDALFLHNHALRVKDELARVAGVADVRTVGRLEIAIRVWPDADKLAAHKLTVKDIVVAVEGQNIRAEAGQPGRPAGGAAPLTFASFGGITDPEQFRKFILKATADGEIIRLGDVSRVEVAASTDGFARVNGKPAALLAVSTQPGEVSADDLRKALDDLGKAAPKGAEVRLVADTAADSLAVVELRLPDVPGVARTREAADRAVKLIRRLPGSPECFAFIEREANAATVLVKAPPKDGPTLADLRKVLAEIKEARARASDLSTGVAFPVRLALTAPERGEKLYQWAEAVAKQIAADGAAADADVYAGREVPQLLVEIDREKMQEIGVTASDIAATLRTAVGGIDVNDFGGFGRTLVVRVRGDKPAVGVDDLGQLAVKAEQGRPVPLRNLSQFRKVTAVPAVLTVDMQPALRITAAPPEGKSAAEATRRCVEIAEVERKKLKLTDDYKVVDLTAGKVR
jgi:multidrug efflux pump subunit AcrB